MSNYKNIKVTEALSDDIREAYDYLSNKSFKDLEGGFEDYGAYLIAMKCVIREEMKLYKEKCEIDRLSRNN